MDGWKEWLSKKAWNCTFVKAKDGFSLKIKAWKCVCKCGSTVPTTDGILGMNG